MIYALYGDRTVEPDFKKVLHLKFFDSIHRLDLDGVPEAENGMSAYDRKP